MVLSGLVDKPNVSHYRLTVHFFMALFLFAYLLRLIFEQLHLSKDYKMIDVNKYFYKLNSVANWLLGVLFVQIMYGGFMAGLKAYKYAPTYPLMNGKLVPAGLFQSESWLLSFFENPLLVNFMHRWIPLVLIVMIIFLVVYARKSGLKPLLKKNLVGLKVMFTLQFLLGIITLVTVVRYEGHVHVHLGVTHQATAVLLFLFTVMTWLQVKKVKQENVL